MVRSSKEPAESKRKITKSSKAKGVNDLKVEKKLPSAK
jgi:hypothetical protein